MPEKAENPKKKMCEDLLNKLITNDEQEAFDLILKSDIGLAEIFKDHFGDIIKIIRYSKKDYEIYIFDIVKNIWEEQSEDRIITNMQEFFPTYIKTQITAMLEKAKLIKVALAKNNDLAEITKFNDTLDKIAADIKKAGKVIDSVRTNYKCVQVFKSLKPNLIDKDFMVNRKKNIISFKNGVYDTKAGKFRDRKKEDNLTFTLDYDYTPTVNKEVRKKIQDIILNICNSDPELYNFNMSFLGYCATGETKEHKFLMIVGEKASNGKTTLLNMFNAVFPDYCFKLHNKTFCEDYTKTHKQFARLKNKSIFLCFIEELSKEKLNVDLLKDFISGDKINNEIMFGTSEDLKILAKLIIITNKSSVFDNDNGIIRRGLLETFINIFMEKKDYDKLENKNGKFVKDKNLIENFENNISYKQEFSRLLLENATKYYKTGLEIPKTVEAEFQALADENDRMKTFINDQLIITDDDKDRVSKKTFLSFWNEMYKKKESWPDILGDVKRLLKYNRTFSCDGSKGCILGVKMRGFEMD